MAATPQAESVRALAEPAFYPHRPACVEHLQTHISHVFLAGPYVYKLKKPVRFPFLDFSTVERRRFFCAEEVRLNRRLCAAVYLDVLPLTRSVAGVLGLGGPGDAVDHVVWMRRLPAGRMLKALLARDAVPGELLVTLAARLAAFHAAAPTGPEIAAHAAPEALRARWEDNLRGAAPFAGHLLPVEDHEILADFGPSFVVRHEALLRARQQAGRIREGHGDLHAEHICFLDTPVADGDLPPLASGIYVFDCIEFSQAFRCNDVAAEVAFLAMDLESLGHPDLARRFVRAYAAASDDAGLEVLLPFYACHLACVRGKVGGMKAAEPEVEPSDRARAEAAARRHFALAVRHAWAAGGPAVVACAGLSGTGKSTLAEALAEATGFVRLGSDAIRKRDSPGTPAVAAYGETLYTPAARAASYAALAAEADAALAARQGVVADATFIRRADRDRLAAVARAHRRPLLFVECRADEAVVRRRLEARTAASSLSDARWDTYLSQRAEREPFAAGEPVVDVDTGAAPTAARAAAMRWVWRWRQGRLPES